jgi:peptidoglycan-N-acetylglucosamine deacetylase
MVTAAVLALLAGCSPAAAPPAPRVPAKVAGGSAAPVPPTPAPPAPALIGVASPGLGRAAGAQLGRAAPVSPATIAAFPQGGGRGAVRRGTVPVVVFHGPRDRKRIALTFDSNMTDGMLRKLAAGKTGTYASTAVVDELQSLHAPATFFLAGKWIQAYPALTRRIAADPDFELASHSWSHEGFRSGCYTLGTIPRADMAADVERSFQILDQFSSRASRYFRFPGGCYDAAALAAIAPVGCTVVEYDDVSADAFSTDTAGIVRRTVTQARPGSIAVLHITQANAPRTADALPQIVHQLRARGYQLVTLGELLGGDG